MDQSVVSSNSISIIGEIASEFTFSHQVYGEGFYTFYMNVSRLSDIYDKLPVTISERLVNISELKEGTMVHITGQVRSYNSFVSEDKRNKLVLTVFARNLEIIDEIETRNPNEIILNGYICKQPVFRKTPFGREISDILLAVNRSYNKSDYIPCIAWGRNARYISGMSVGDNVTLYGRMQSRNYQKKFENGDVVEKTAYEISISKIEINDAEEEDEQKEIE